MKLVTLTDWESGLEIMVDPSDIKLLQRCPAYVGCDYGSDSPHEVGERTRVDTSRQTLLVRETPSEIAKLAKAL